MADLTARYWVSALHSVLIIVREFDRSTISHYPVCSVVLFLIFHYRPPFRSEQTTVVLFSRIIVLKHCSIVRNIISYYFGNPGIRSSGCIGTIDLERELFPAPKCALLLPRIGSTVTGTSFQTRSAYRWKRGREQYLTCTQSLASPRGRGVKTSFVPDNQYAKVSIGGCEPG